MRMVLPTMKFISALACLVCIALCTGKQLNDRPIIGIMAQETYDEYVQFGPSMVVSSYVKFVESAGARAVLVRINQPMDYYKKLYNSLNGLVLPGGGQLNVLESGYGKAIKIMFDLSIEGKKKGDYFPIWGTCQGFQVLACIVAGRDILINGLDSENLPLPLEITSDFVKSRMFDVLTTPGFVLDALVKEESTYNAHHSGVTPTNFTKFGLDKFFRRISVNKDRNGVEFISTMEAYNYPIYAVQWHPEKNVFTWDLKTAFAIPHTPEAVAVSQYCSNFLISEARKSKHSFPTEEEASKYLVFNYQPVYIGNVSASELAYFPDV